MCPRVFWSQTRFPCFFRYVEVNKQKAPIVKAWEGRKRTWPFVFVLMVACVGPLLMIGLIMGTCALKHPDTGELMWMICPQQ